MRDTSELSPRASERRRSGLAMMAAATAIAATATSATLGVREGKPVRSPLLLAAAVAAAAVTTTTSITTTTSTTTTTIIATTTGITTTTTTTSVCCYLCRRRHQHLFAAPPLPSPPPPAGDIVLDYRPCARILDRFVSFPFSPTNPFISRARGRERRSECSDTFYDVTRKNARAALNGDRSARG